MSIKVKKEKARAVLREALAGRQEINDDISRAIGGILKGTHKTYRYVLFTALVAKATDEDVDSLSIQTRDSSPGAYNARDLCHTVVVPFEREYAPYGLGGSNEPFLNKPARFKRLSLDNAVRSGNDKETLSGLIDILSRIRTKDEAFKYLSYAVSVVRSISREYGRTFSFEGIAFSDENIQAILDYVDRLTERTCNGETCPLVVASLESLCFPLHRVVAHKVNECGASSKETGDIDIYVRPTSAPSKGKWILESSIEIKDKDFSEQDVQHAITKFKAANLGRTLFVYGKNASFDHTGVRQVAARYGRLGTYCAIISIMDYSRLRLYDSSADLAPSAFAKSIMKYAKMINAKAETVSWLKECLEK